ncbi:MIF4G-domain-containing protein [Thozetella sp. PMI_491]|nr:MIF4G-domain-containing protein [Thozetella sp. PMI_491]
MRSGGTYIPPARLRALQAQITDKKSKEYQRMAWEALKKSIKGLINKINVSNIKHIIPELFGENLIRGRGLFCQSIIQAQHASLPFTPIYAALMAIANTKLPILGELLAKRLVMRFRKAFRRNDKTVCLSSTMFIAHLVNTQVCSATLAAQILLLLLHKPTDDSVEIAVGLTREVGSFLEQMEPAISMAVFDQFRTILHEADIDRRVQYMIEVLFQTRKDKYKDNPAIKEELDLVEEEDQITHQIDLDGDIDVQDGLNIFKFDENWEENEEEYKKLKAEILGEGSDDEDDDEDDESESGSEDEEQKAMDIKDQSNADLVNLRRTIYLTIQSSADPEEATHKLMKLRLPPGQETELVSMVVESCAQERTYIKFFGLIGERFARLNRMWRELYEESFAKYFETIHRYDANKLRNIARFFGHLFATDALGWHVLSVIHLNEEETTAASRIFIKILFEDIQENIGAKQLTARLSDETLKPSLEGLFPHDNPRNIRFSINYFTSIKMGYLTEEMRTFLQNMPKPALPAPPAHDDSDADSVSSYSSYTGSSYSSRSRSRSAPGSPRRRAVDRRRSPSRSVSRSRSLSRTPPRRARRSSDSPGGRGRSRSYSRTPSRHPRGRSYSRDSRDSRSLSRSRSPSHSRSPTPRRGAARRRNSSSVSGSSRSRSPAPRRQARKDSRSESPRSRSPPPRRQPPARRGSRSASPQGGPPRYRDRSYSRGRSPTRSVSADRSPPPEKPQRKRRNSSSLSRSPPRRRARIDPDAGR